MPIRTSGSYQALDLSPDGTRLLVAGGRGLDVWEVRDGSAVLAGEVVLRNEAGHISWGAFVGEGMVLASYRREAPGSLNDIVLAAWKIQPLPDAETLEKQNTTGGPKAGEPLWRSSRHPYFLPRLSPGRRLVAFWNEGGVKFAEPATGKLVAALPAARSRQGFGIAFDDAFTHAAVVWEDGFTRYLTVYDLRTGNAAREFPVDKLTNGPRAWLGATHLMLEDGTVFDVGQQRPVWRYEHENRVLHAAVRPDGRYWYLAPPAEAGKPATLAAAVLPDAAALAAGAGGGGGGPSHVPTVGMRVSIHLDFAGPSRGADDLRRRVKERLEQSLRNAGMVPDPAAPAKLTVSIKPRDTGRVREFREFPGLLGGGDPLGTTRRISLRNLIGTIQLSDGAGSPPVTVHHFLVRDQSSTGQRIEGASDIATYLLDQQWALMEKELGPVRFPTHIPRGGAAAPPIGTSKLDAPSAR